MPSNADPIVAQIQQDMQALITYVTGPETATQTAYTVELTLFRRLLALGAALLRLFFLSRAALRPSAPITANRTLLTYHDQRMTTYVSVFGTLRFARHYFVTPGQAGCCPLDAALSLPARCYSDLLREWTDYDATDGAYRETASTIERILGLDLSIQALERSVGEDAQDVAPFYASREPPPTRRLRAASWSCRPMEKASRWCSHQLPPRRSDWPKARNAPRRRRPSSPASTPSHPTYGPRRMCGPLCCTRSAAPTIPPGRCRCRKRAARPWKEKLPRYRCSSSAPLSATGAISAPRGLD
jgi:hypothetical protein